MERNYTKIYFLGIGGIGMSALARYYMVEGLRPGMTALLELKIEN